MLQHHRGVRMHHLSFCLLSRWCKLRIDKFGGGTSIWFELRCRLGVVWLCLQSCCVPWNLFLLAHLRIVVAQCHQSRAQRSCRCVTIQSPIHALLVRQAQTGLLMLYSTLKALDWLIFWGGCVASDCWWVCFATLWLVSALCCLESHLTTLISCTLRAVRLLDNFTSISAVVRDDWLLGNWSLCRLVRSRCLPLQLSFRLRLGRLGITKRSACCKWSDYLVMSASLCAKQPG